MLGFRPPPPLHEIGARRGGHKRLRKKQAPLQGGASPFTVTIEDELPDARAALRARHNAELRAAFKEDPSSLSADDRARVEQLLARDARKAAKKAARSSEGA